MVQDGQAPGSAGLQLAGGAPLLRPEEQVLAAMLDGLAGPAAGPQPGVLDNGKAGWRRSGAFIRHADAFQWAWGGADAR